MKTTDVAESDLNDGHAPRSISGRRITVTASCQLLARLLGVGAGVLVAAALARNLGTERYGKLTLVFAIVGLATGAGDFGVGQVATREVAARPHERNRVAGALVLLRLSTGLALMGLGAALTADLFGLGGDWVASILILSTLVLGSVSGLSVVAQARLRPEVTAWIVLIQSFAWLAVVIVIGLAGGGLVAYGEGFLAVGFLQAGITWLLVRNVTAVHLRGAVREAGRLLRHAWPLGVAGLFVTTYYQVDTLLVYRFKGAAQTALYGSAYRFLDVLQVLPGTVLAVLLPILAAAVSRGQFDLRTRKVFHLALTLALAAALPVAVGGAVLSNRIVTLIYGRPFTHAGPLLAVLIPSFIFISLGYVFSGLLISARRVGAIAVIACVGLALNLPANIVLIPRFGAIAAAWTTLLTELVVGCAMATLVARQFRGSLPWGRWARCLAAAGVLLAVAIALRHTVLPLAVGLPAAVYAAMLLAFGGVTVDDLRVLLNRQQALTA